MRKRAYFLCSLYWFTLSKGYNLQNEEYKGFSSERYSKHPFIVILFNITFAPELKHFFVKKQLFIYALGLLTLMSFPMQGIANNSEEGHKQEEGKLDIKGEIFGHIRDAHDWHITTIGGKHITIPLPVIIYSTSKGLDLVCPFQIVKERKRGQPRCYERSVPRIWATTL